MCRGYVLSLAETDSTRLTIQPLLPAAAAPDLDRPNDVCIDLRSGDHAHVHAARTGTYPCGPVLCGCGYVSFVARAVCPSTGAGMCPLWLVLCANQLVMFVTSCRRRVAPRPCCRWQASDDPETVVQQCAASCTVSCLAVGAPSASQGWRSLW